MRASNARPYKYDISKTNILGKGSDIMSEISSTIRLNDRMSDPLKRITVNVERLTERLEKMAAVSRKTQDLSSVYSSMAEGLRELFKAADNHKVMQLVGNAFKYTASAAVNSEKAFADIYRAADGMNEQLCSMPDTVLRTPYDSRSVMPDTEQNSISMRNILTALISGKEYPTSVINISERVDDAGSVLTNGYDKGHAAERLLYSADICRGIIADIFGAATAYKDFNEPLSLPYDLHEKSYTNDPVSELMRKISDSIVIRFRYDIVSNHSIDEEVYPYIKTTGNKIGDRQNTPGLIYDTAEGSADEQEKQSTAVIYRYAEPKAESYDSGIMTSVYDIASLIRDGADGVIEAYENALKYAPNNISFYGSREKNEIIQANTADRTVSDISAVMDPVHAPEIPDAGTAEGVTDTIINLCRPAELFGDIMSGSKAIEGYTAACENYKKNADGSSGLMDKNEYDHYSPAVKADEYQALQYDHLKQANEAIGFMSGLTEEKLEVSQNEIKQYALGTELLKQQMQTGSVDIIELVSEMKSAVDNKNESLVKDTIIAMGKISEEQGNYEENTSEWLTDADNKAQDVYDKYYDAVRKVSYLEAPVKSAGYSVMNAYAQGIISGGQAAVGAAQSIADNVQSILSMPTISFGASAISSIMTTVTQSGVKQKLASGTRSALPGLTLVGEEGPELVTFRGGESVYNALETKRIMEKMQHMGDTSVYIPSSVHEALSMSHDISGLSDYGYSSMAIPKEEDNELKLSDSDREYLIALGERSAVNSAASNDIKIEMVNNNNISSEADVDGIIDHLARGLQNALAMTAEGVHK